MPINFSSRDAVAEGYSPEKTEPYDTKSLVTEEDINTLKQEIHRLDWWPISHGSSGVDHSKELDIIDRMWQEIQSLRSVLRKQIY